MRIVLCVIVLALAGCASSKARLATAQSNCSAYGFERGTQAYASCMQRENHLIIERNRRAQAQVQDSLDRLSKSLGPAPAAAVAPPPISRTHCDVWRNDIDCVTVK